MAEPEGPTPMAQALIPVKEPELQLGVDFWFAFWSLAVLGLTAALDSATLALALPVRACALLHCSK